MDESVAPDQVKWKWVMESEVLEPESAAVNGRSGAQRGAVQPLPRAANGAGEIVSAVTKPAADGANEVTVTVTNEGLLPTALEIAKRVKIVQEDTVASTTRRRKQYRAQVAPWVLAGRSGRAALAGAEPGAGSQRASPNGGRHRLAQTA